jgi:hypothetical protein
MDSHITWTNEEHFLVYNISQLISDKINKQFICSISKQIIGWKNPAGTLASGWVQMIQYFSGASSS